MKLLNLGLLILLFTTLAYTTAFAAGIECTKATSSVEKMICNDKELYQLDEKLSAIYKISSNNSEVKHSQQNWLIKIRNQCKNTICLKNAYTIRIAELTTAQNTNTTTPQTQPSVSENDKAVLVITSDSSVGIRAFQGGGTAEGKIVLHNAGTETLRNLQLTIFNQSTDLHITKNNCNGILQPGNSCFYTVNYAPIFDPKKTDEVKNKLVTFIASAADQNGLTTQDSYTMKLQNVSNDSWVKVDELISVPAKGIDLIKVRRGNQTLLYATTGMGVIRTTDEKHWSFVGANWKNNWIPNVDTLCSLSDNRLAEGENNNLYSTAATRNEISVIKYDGKLWLPLKIQPSIKCKSKSYISLLYSSNGNLYLGGTFGVKKYDGQKWSTLGGTTWNKQEMQSSKKNSVNTLLESNDMLYAGTNAGVVKFDGKSWVLVGANDMANNIKVNSLASFNNQLYAATDLGILDFDGKNWQFLGQESWSQISGSQYPYTSNAFSVTASEDGNIYADGYAGILKFNNANKNWDVVAGYMDYEALSKPLVIGDRLYGLFGSAIGYYENKTWRYADGLLNYWPVDRITTDANGNLYAWWGQCNGDDKSNCRSGVTKYDGQNWIPLTSTSVPQFKTDNDLNKIEINYNSTVKKIIGKNYVNKILIDGKNVYVASSWGCPQRRPFPPQPSFDSADTTQHCNNTGGDNGVYKYDGKNWVQIGDYNDDTDSQNDKLSDCFEAATLLKANGVLYASCRDNANDIDSPPTSSIAKLVNNKWDRLGFHTWNNYESLTAYNQRIAASDLQIINGFLYAAGANGVYQYYPAIVKK